MDRCMARARIGDQLRNDGDHFVAGCRFLSWCWAWRAVAQRRLARPLMRQRKRRQRARRSQRMRQAMTDLPRAKGALPRSMRRLM